MSPVRKSTIQLSLFKTCNRGDQCVHPDGPLLPATTEYFYKHPNTTDGLAPLCKECHKATSRQYRVDHADDLKAYFYRYRLDHSDQRRDAGRLWRARTVEARREYGRQWREGNADYHRQRVREWDQAHPEEARARSRRYYHKDVEASRARARAKYARPHIRAQKSEYARYWKRAHREHIAAQARLRYWDDPARGVVVQNRRRARKRHLPDTLTKAQWEACLEYWGRRCCVCGREEGNGYRIVADHWIALSDPRSDNPGTVVTNIVPLCQTYRAGNAPRGCNNSKGRYDALAFLTRELGEDAARRKREDIEAYFRWVSRTL